MNDKTSEFEDDVLNKYDTCEIDFYDMRVYADDIESIRQTLISIDIHTSHIVCYYFWSWWSNKLDASWLKVDINEVVRVATKDIKLYK